MAAVTIKKTEINADKVRTSKSPNVPSFAGTREFTTYALATTPKNEAPPKPVRESISSGFVHNTTKPRATDNK
jgi:hypothetical protein